MPTTEYYYDGRLFYYRLITDGQGAKTLDQLAKDGTHFQTLTGHYSNSEAYVRSVCRSVLPFSEWQKAERLLISHVSR